MLQLLWKVEKVEELVSDFMFMRYYLCHYSGKLSCLLCLILPVLCYPACYQPLLLTKDIGLGRIQQIIGITTPPTSCDIPPLIAFIEQFFLLRFIIDD